MKDQRTQKQRLQKILKQIAETPRADSREDKTLSDEEIRRLAQAIKKVLHKSLH